MLPLLELGAKLECGLRQAMALHPGLEGKIVHAGKGVDLNGVLMGSKPEKGTSRGRSEAATGEASTRQGTPEDEGGDS